MSEKFLDKIYTLDGSDPRDIYTQWSDTYDSEVSENGYATPQRIAKALAMTLTDTTVPILDYGCGTGLSGLALTQEGFSTIDGIDITQSMLDKAQSLGLYRSLTLFDPENGPPISHAQYQVIVAVGVISTGAAPPEVLDTIVDMLPVGGYVAMSLNDHALAEPQYPNKIASHIQGGTLEMIVEDYGDHLPGLGLKSKIYVMKKI